MTLNLTPCEIARKTIESYLSGKKFELDEEIKEKYSEEKACFVTLAEKETRELRGCIGCLEPNGNSLWKNIQENAINSAFNDPRFPTLDKTEFSKIKIEVSVLSKPKKLEFKDEKDLLNKINNKMGLILKKGFNQSTFLPQVWEQLPDKTEFLEHLSLKAGLNKDAWKSLDIEIWYYDVEKFEE